MAEEKFKNALKTLVEKILKEVVDRRYRERKKLEHPEYWHYKSYIGREVAEKFEEETGLRILYPTKFFKNLGVDIDEPRRSVIEKEVKEDLVFLYTSTLEDISKKCDVSETVLDRLINLSDLRKTKFELDELGGIILEIFSDGKPLTASEAYSKIKEKAGVTKGQVYGRLGWYAKKGILLTERGLPGEKIYGIDRESLEERRSKIMRERGVLNLEKELVFPPERHLEEYAVIQALGRTTKNKLGEIFDEKRAKGALNYLRRTKLLKYHKEDGKFVYTPAFKIKPIHLKKAVETVIKAKSKTQAKRIMSEDFGLDFNSYCENQNVTPWGVRSILLSLRSKSRLTESELVKDLERRMIDPEERAREHMKFVYENQEALRLLTPYSLKIDLSKKEKWILLSD